MMLFLTLVGIGLALLVFLNGMQAADKTRTPRDKEGRGDRSRPVLDAKKVLKMPPGENRPRICPVCGTVLGPEDYLIAALEPEPKSERKRQAHIYGCPFCVESGGVNVSRSRQLSRIEP